MNQKDINFYLKKEKYSSLEEYIDIASNEILSDDVWLWRKLISIKERLHVTEKNELVNILKNIIKKNNRKRRDRYNRLFKWKRC